MFRKIWDLLKKLGRFTAESNQEYYSGNGWSVPFYPEMEKNNG